MSSFASSLFLAIVAAVLLAGADAGRSDPVRGGVVVVTHAAPALLVEDAHPGDPASLSSSGQAVAVGPSAGNAGPLGRLVGRSIRHVASIQGRATAPRLSSAASASRATLRGWLEFTERLALTRLGGLTSLSTAPPLLRSA